VAAGIAGVLSNHRSGIDCYHVVNPHWDDGVSLDAIVGWVSEARGGVRHIQDYAQWCAPGPPRGPPILPLQLCLGAGGAAAVPWSGTAAVAKGQWRPCARARALWAPSRPAGQVQVREAARDSRRGARAAGTRSSRRRWRAWTASARATRRCRSSTSGRRPSLARAPSAALAGARRALVRAWWQVRRSRLACGCGAPCACAQARVGDAYLPRMEPGLACLAGERTWRRARRSGRRAARRFDASKMRAGVRAHTRYQDVPHLDRAFILQNLRHMEALHIIDPA